MNYFGDVKLNNFLAARYTMAICISDFHIQRCAKPRSCSRAVLFPRSLSKKRAIFLAAAVLPEQQVMICAACCVLL